MPSRLQATLLLVFALANSGAWAQGRKSAIAGSVADESGGLVSGALVTAVHTATGESRSVSTNKSGFYRLPLLEIGVYRVTASLDGFKVSRHEGVVLELDREAVVDHVLQVGDLAESVVVSGQAHLIEATPSALTSLVDSATIQQLPLNGRDYIQLATLEAGAPIDRTRARNANFGYGVNISISGSRPAQNDFRLDGVSLNTYNGSTPGSVNGINLGVDAIQEFSVHSSTYSAQYGRAAGGIVNAVTKSGGNEFHGSAFYFHRNDNLDARNFFDAGPPPEFRRHQFGGSVGGPLVREKTFFFANYEGLREARGNTTINTTLTAQARNGNLRGGTVQVDPLMAKVAALYPLPNGAILGDTGLFSFPNDEVGNEGFVTARLDHKLSDRDKFFLRYSYDDGARRSESDFALGRRSNSTRIQSAALEDSHIFSPNILTAVRLGFLRTFTVEGQYVSQVPAADDPDLAFVPGSGVLGSVIVTGLTDLPGGSGAIPTDRHAFDSFQLSDDWTWLRGRHSFKFGGLLEFTRFNTDSQTRAAGDFRFRTIAQLLTNVPDRFRAQLPGSDTIRAYRQWIGAFYFHDTLQLAKRLTLDLGLRWESTDVPVEVHGKIANLERLADPAVRTGNPLFQNPSQRNFDPRVGLAWDVTGDGATMVRGGFGMFPDLILSNSLVLSGVRNPPFFLRGEIRTLNKGDFPKLGYLRLVANPIPEYRVERYQRDPAQPYVQQWNLNIERTLDRQSSLRIGYVGSHGLNLSSITADANLVEPVASADGRPYFPAKGTRINSVFSRIRDHTFNAESFYHGLQTRFQHRMRRGVQTQLSYSFSKSMDDSSNFLSDAEASNGAMLPLNGSPKFNRGLSGQDVRHYVAASGTWELPLRDGPGWRRMVGSWQLGGIVTYGSGMPTSVWVEYDAARTGTSEVGPAIGQRPDLAPGAANNPVTGDPRGWVNAGAFRRPEPGFLGNLGRNTIIGPNMADVDFSLVKSIRFSERRQARSLDFRFEFFNLFNRANFDLPLAERMAVFAETSAREDFARITSAGKSREIQFGLKFRF